jgi:hypothetical protein
VFPPFKVECAHALRATASLPSGTQTHARRLHFDPDKKKGREP